MRVTLLVDSLPQWLQRPVMALSEAVFLIYSIAVCYLGIEITQQAVERGKTLSATQWSTAVLYAAIIFSGLLCTLRLGYSLYRIVMHGESCFAHKGGLEE